jgi:membrane fusion protein (multidrug efflux system)
MTKYLFISVAVTSILVCLVIGPGKSAVASAPVQVEAFRVSSKPDETIWSGPGSAIRCAETLDAGFEVTGVVSEVLVDMGALVTEGQILVRLDNSVLDAEIEVKKAEIKIAQAQRKFCALNYDKQKELHGKKVVSDRDLEEAACELEKAEASIQKLRAEITALEARKRQRILRAPIEGVVAKNSLGEGEAFVPGITEALKIIQCDEVIAVIPVGEEYYWRIHTGQQVVIVVDALNRKKFKGRVDRIRPLFDPENKGFFTVESRIKNPGTELADGMFFQASIHPPETGTSVWISERALIPTLGKEAFVYVVKDNVAVRRKIVVGARMGDRVRVASGLNEGDLIIVKGHENIPDLSEVIITHTRE